jgi:uncharacterized coiled-coil protein SlyX
MSDNKPVGPMSESLEQIAARLVDTIKLAMYGPSAAHGDYARAILDALRAAQASVRAEAEARIAKLTERCSHQEAKLMKLEAETVARWERIKELEAERDAYKRDFEGELAGNMVMRQRFGAKDSETMHAFLERTLEANSGSAEGRAAWQPIVGTLRAIRGWDMLDATADGPYWKRTIDAALALLPSAPAAEPQP